MLAERLRLAALVLAGLLATATAQARTLQVVLSDETAFYQRFQQAFQTSWPKGVADLRFIPVADYQPSTATLSVAVGLQASIALLDAPLQGPLIITLVPRTTLDPLIQAPQIQEALTQRELLPIYPDQPLQRQVNLAQLLQPGLTHLGTLYGPYSASLRAPLEQMANHRKLVLKQAAVHPEDNPLAALTTIVEQSDLFLALPDQPTFNNTTSRWILLLSYRQGIPVIGYSQSYTDAGAMVSLFSTPEQQARQAAALALHRLNTHGWPEGPLSPDEFSISINSAVADRLGYSGLSEEYLELQLKRMEPHSR